MDLETIETIRFTLGLGDSEDILSDLEIQAMIDQYPVDWRLAAAALADHLAVRAINRPTSFAATGRMSVQWTDRAKMWQSIARSLRQQVADDEKREVGNGAVGTAQLKTAGVTWEDTEYSRPRKPWSWKE